MSISKQEFWDEMNDILDKESVRGDVSKDFALSVVRERIQTKATNCPLAIAAEGVEEELNNIMRERLLEGKVDILEETTPVRAAVSLLLYQMQHGW